MLDKTILQPGVPAGRVAKLNLLIDAALEMGVTAAAVVSADEIKVDQKLADICLEPGCEWYGLSMSCPPHVAGPAGFSKLLEKFEQALFFRIDVPADLLYSSDRFEVFGLLHELAAGIEQQAIRMGFSGARAYAGGSCKQIFCRAHSDCRVLSGTGKCRNPESARPSMSGFGVDVARLIKTAGWKEVLLSKRDCSEQTQMAGVYGLVLIG